jgi:taurine dioxygenase
MAVDAARSPAPQIAIAATGAGVGAEIVGIDLRDLDEGDFAFIRQAFVEQPVLLFRGQRLADADLIAFSRRFGALDLAPVQENGRRFVEGHPEIYVVSNVIENGVALGSLGAGEAAWHADMTYLEDPPMASMLYALEVPASGGTTGFCNLYSAYDALPEALKRRVTGLGVKHDGTYNSGGYLRLGVTPSDDPRRSPGAVHPVVCTHPESRRRCLYLGRRHNAYLVGLDLAESEEVLDALWACATRPQFIWHHAWRAGDLVMWDNRCTMHRRDPFDPGARRIMHRTQIKGTTRPAP